MSARYIKVLLAALCAHCASAQFEGRLMNGSLIFSTGSGICGGTKPGAAPVFIVGACAQLAPSDSVGQISFRMFDSMSAANVEFLKLMPGDWQTRDASTSVLTEWVRTSGTSFGSAASFKQEYSSVSFVTSMGSTFSGSESAFGYQVQSMKFINQDWTFTEDDFFLKIPHPTNYWFKACAGAWSSTAGCTAKSLGAGAFKNSVLLMLSGKKIVEELASKDAIVWTQVISTKAFGTGQTVKFYNGNTEVTSWDGAVFTSLRISGAGPTLEYSFDTDYKVGTYTRDVDGLYNPTTGDVATTFNTSTDRCNSPDMPGLSGCASCNTETDCVIALPEFATSNDSFTPTQGTLWENPTLLMGGNPFDVSTPAAIDALWSKQPSITPTTTKDFGMPQFTITAAPTNGELRIRRANLTKHTPKWAGFQDGFECEPDQNTCFVVELAFPLTSGSNLKAALHNDPSTNAYQGWNSGAFIIYDPTMRLFDPAAPAPSPASDNYTNSTPTPPPTAASAPTPAPGAVTSTVNALTYQWIMLLPGLLAVLALHY